MADSIKYLVAIDPETDAAVKAERLGPDGELSEVPAEAFTLNASKLTEAISQDEPSEPGAGEPDGSKPDHPPGVPK